MPVAERLHRHVLLHHVLAGQRGGREERVPSRQRRGVRRDGREQALDPLAAVELVQRRGAPVERLRRALDPEDGGHLLREVDAAVVGAPDVRDVDRLLRVRVEVPALPAQELRLRDRR